VAESLKGQLLIAAPILIDPNFRRSVVLVIEHSEEGALGVVLNRPTDLPVAEAVPELSQLDGGCVFAGGPVQPQAVIALAEYAGAPPEGAVCGPIAPVGVDSDMDTLGDRVTRVRGGPARGGARGGLVDRRAGAARRRLLRRRRHALEPRPRAQGWPVQAARAHAGRSRHELNTRELRG
jgi:putative transcriptional regulator